VRTSKTIVSLVVLTLACSAFAVDREDGRSISAAASDHWAFQPLVNPVPPDVNRPAWIRNPIDAFVLARLDEAGLKSAPEADRRTLIRRASYALTGLPPSPEAVEAFVDDPNPRAYEKLVDRLLDSPRYGEQLGRRWLDVARYSDTKGYVYGREERFWTHAWAYRDWVVRTLNEDMPYDRFLRLQLAADQIADRREGDLAAMGFLTLGRRFLGVQRDIIDDRIDVVTRGTMALTVSCARCHDHKYDPIPTADYYSLYGVFESSAERLSALGDKAVGGEAFQTELSKRWEKLRETMAQRRSESSARVRANIAGYLKAQTELDKYPADGFDQIFAKTDLLPSFVRRWESYLREAERRKDPIFVPWHAFAKLPAASFSERARDETSKLNEAGNGAIHPLVAAAFATPPASFQDVIDRYGKLLTEIDSKWAAALKAAVEKKVDSPAGLVDPVEETLRRVLYGADAPCEVPDLPVVHNETFFASGETTELWKLQGEVDRWIVRSKAHAPFALAMVDRPDPADARVMIRGNPLKRGEKAPRRFLSALAGEKPQLFKQGSGRLELANAIVDPANPLTARVIVNRIWAHHFGRGLVPTPSDFGLRSETPSHPRLLDWLTSEFITGGWSLKKLHRRIVLSATFRQSSARPVDAAFRMRVMENDPDNRLLWRMEPRRLTYEEFRDSMLAATDDLNLRAGGKPVDLFAKPFPDRRTIYGLVDRQFLPGTLRIFDFANPDLHIPQRPETTVPQQALFFMNHPLVIERATALAAASDNSADPEARIRMLFRRALQRDPDPTEVAEARAFVKSIAGPAAQPPPPNTSVDWQYGYGKVDETAGGVSGFKKLPYFSGEAWTGGPKWPDAKLGWVQLTAAGGHPGNTRSVASVRRWTAPRAMTIALRSRLIHEPAAGDGIRAFIISSRAGVLKTVKIHRKTVDLDVEALPVVAGETIDFVVDIDTVLNSDQYLWSATLAEKAGSGNAATVWSSQKDFVRLEAPNLTAWEQLAQTLLCSNEFMFVD
jgi:hypothetical protein